MGAVGPAAALGDDPGVSVDRLTREHRSWLMSRIASKNTKPELAVRSTLHRLGFRFRLHRRGLPGTPDLVLPRFRVVVFVHGCFWHGHYCKREKMPKTNRRFWGEKIEANRTRDLRNRRALSRLGWRSLVVWECQAADPVRLALRLERFFAER